jgi:hypothetical protein
MMLGLLISLLTPVFNPEAKAAEILKTVTLNFNSETVPEDTRSMLRDRRFVAATRWIKENAPDVIFIEEGWNYRGSPSIIKSLAESTGYSYHYRLTMGLNGLLLDSNGVLLKPGHQFVEKHSYKLPHAAPTFGDGKTWIVSLGATAWGIGGKILTAGGNTVYAYATHLIGDTESKRSDQILGLHQEIEQEIKNAGESIQDAKIIIAGDLNQSPKSQTLNNLGILGYSDSFLAVHPEAQIESSDCTFCSNPTNSYFNPLTVASNQFPSQDTIDGDLRIDYILSRGKGMTPLASTIGFTEPLNGVWMSDHFGVMSSFALGESLQGELPVLDNPDHDRTHSISKTRVIEITDQDLYCTSKGCSHSLGALDVSTLTGVTFINRTKRLLEVDLSGKGKIWPTPFAFLKPDRVAAFFFDVKNSTYSFDAHHILGIKVLNGKLVTQ